ncbi:hypothetical protein ACSBR1_032202 [Camellia fascicularis]
MSCFVSKALVNVGGELAKLVPGRVSTEVDARLAYDTHSIVRKVERNIDLVYGGGSVGLMGLISQAVYDGGHHVLGVIPKTLMRREGTTEINGKSALETKMERLDYKSTKLRFLM